jgi:3-deoxy-D-manno-oct-2-ulosonic acid (Kdo) hydroxylase
MTAASTVIGQEIPNGCSRVIAIDDVITGEGNGSAEKARMLCRELEIGNILLLNRTPFLISRDDRELLLGQKQTSSAYHKNIAYRPIEDRVTGLEGSEKEHTDYFRRILGNYSEQVSKFLNEAFYPYREQWKLDYASFRAIEEKGRVSRLHARNDLLHFDSFPTRPTQGGRILRVFTNINPVQNRVWLTSKTFEACGPTFARSAQLEAAKQNSTISRFTRFLASTVRSVVTKRSPYDEVMHRCHNAMKEDEEFQRTTPKQRWEFPPDSSWIAFTDCVSHAVLEGQYALEQTFVIPQKALVEPERSPLAILERIAKNSASS